MKTRKIIELVIDYREIPIGILLGCVSYWWQVHQGSLEVTWNFGMGVMGLIGGICLGMME